MQTDRNENARGQRDVIRTVCWRDGLNVMIYCCWSANRSEAYAKLRWAGVEKWQEHRAVEAQAQLRSNGGGSQCKSPREKAAARALAPVTVSAW